ncbi:hypothetical protein Q5752_002522 [Cryptotrichosporon argae]
MSAPAPSLASHTWVPLFASAYFGVTIARVYPLATIPLLAHLSVVPLDSLGSPPTPGSEPPRLPPSPLPLPLILPLALGSFLHDLPNLHLLPSTLQAACLQAAVPLLMASATVLLFALHARALAGKDPADEWGGCVVFGAIWVGVWAAVEAPEPIGALHVPSLLLLDLPPIVHVLRHFGPPGLDFATATCAYAVHVLCRHATPGADEVRLDLGATARGPTPDIIALSSREGIAAATPANSPEPRSAHNRRAAQQRARQAEQAEHAEMGTRSPGPA